jgi:hypothetical protein
MVLILLQSLIRTQVAQFSHRMSLPVPPLHLCGGYLSSIVWAMGRIITFSRQMYIFLSTFLSASFVFTFKMITPWSLFVIIATVRREGNRRESDVKGHCGVSSLRSNVIWCTQAISIWRDIKPTQSESLCALKHGTEGTNYSKRVLETNGVFLGS